MYYLKLIQRFWDFNQTAKLNSSAIVIYLYLLNSANDNDGYEVTISDVALSNALGMARTTLIPSKEKLRDLGLIKYGSRKGFPCKYRLLLDYSLDSRSGELKEPQNTAVKNFILKEISGDSSENKIQDKSALEKYAKAETTFSEPQEEEPLNVNNGDDPSCEEFLEYAKTLNGYESSLDPAIKGKYHLWSQNNWKNSSGRIITNWKSTLKSILPYLKNSSEDHLMSLKDLPSIKHPESQNNEQ